MILVVGMWETVIYPNGKQCSEVRSPVAVAELRSTLFCRTDVKTAKVLWRVSRWLLGK
jgi:hypothetical protein